MWWFSSAWERTGVQLWAIAVSSICEQSTGPVALRLQVTQRAESLQLTMRLDLTAITKQIHYQPEAARLPITEHQRKKCDDINVHDSWCVSAQCCIHFKAYINSLAQSQTVQNTVGSF